MRRRNSGRSEGSADFLEAINMYNLGGIVARVQNFELVTMKFGCEEKRTREFRR